MKIAPSISVPSMESGKNISILWKMESCEISGLKIFAAAEKFKLRTRFSGFRTHVWPSASPKQIR